MLRLALRPRWLALLALALLFATVFATLGNWQLGRSRQAAPAAETPAILPLTDVLDPQQELDGTSATTPVTVTGRVDTSHPVTLITGRQYQGEPVSWVVVPVLVEGSGARLATVLGVVPAGQPAPQVHPGRVDFEGVLQFPEQPLPPAGDGTYTSLGVAQFLNAWGTPVYSAFTFSDQATADQVTTGVRALPMTPPEQSGGFALLNLSYALQWWVFAAFAVFIWWRMLKDSHTRQRQDTHAPHSPERQPT